MRFISEQFIISILASSCLVAALPQMSGGRIVGGTAVNKIFDFMTYLRLQSAEGINFRCGASLIAPNAIVTAAHCVEGMSVSKIETAINSLVGTIKQRNGTSYKSIDVIIHEDYNYYDNDIAVIIVEEEVNGLHNGRKPVPIRIANNAVGDNFSLVALGFGLTHPEGTNPNKLMWVELQNMPIATCRRQWRSVNERNVCAFSNIPGRSMCRGDSGGPLYGFSPNGSPVLVGLTSYGDKDCNIGGTTKSSVYTNLFHFKDWLKSKIPHLEEGLPVVKNAPGDVENPPEVEVQSGDEEPPIATPKVIENQPGNIAELVEEKPETTSV